MHASIRLLGGFEILIDDRPVPPSAWARRSSAALVKLLALAPEHRLPRERVIDALWPDLPPDRAAPRLHTAAHYARVALGARNGVVLDRDAVALLPGAAVTVDAGEFTSAAEAAGRGGSPTAVTAALDRYAGDLLPDDVYEPWTEQARNQLRMRHLELLRAAGRWEEVLAADPADEEAHLSLAQEHVRGGRRQAALRQLDLMAEVFRRELDTDAGPAAERLRTAALALPAEGRVTGHRAAPRGTPVPVPPTPTIGRERDVARVLRLLDHERIVTVLGTGGVGKTRLAVEVALRHSVATGQDACYVDLTEVDEPGLVPQLICRELGHSGAPANAEAGLAEALRGRSLLLVLDNFEHVAEAAPIVGRLVGLTPGLRVLSTSRTRLRVRGEHVHDVAPLSVRPDRPGPGGGPGPGPAVTLFAQAASAVDPGFDLDRHLPDVVAICRQVDGLPLAIELAAGQVRTLPPALLRARLGARLGSPAGAARDGPRRQQTMPATIDWSLQLLPEDERRLFTELGVFAGDAPLEAVEQVCGDGSVDVVDALTRLVDHSLVQRVTSGRGEPRYRLLRLLRERARALLPADAAAALRMRHAAWVVGVLEDLDERRWTDEAFSRDQMSPLLPLEIRAAHARAERHGDWPTAARITALLATSWHREWYHRDSSRWVAAALAHEQDLDPLLVARLHIAGGLFTWVRDQPEARRHYAAGIAICRRLAPGRYLAYALALTAATFVGDESAFPAAIALSDESIALARDVGEKPLIAQALNIKAELTRIHGDDATARTVSEEGRDLAAQSGDSANLSLFLANLGSLAERRGDLVEARRLLGEALRLSWSLGRRMVTAWILGELAGPETGLGHQETAARMLGAADAALRAVGAERLPGDRPEYDRVVAALRQALGDRAFGRLHAEGARLALDEAVELALAEPGRATVAVIPPARAGSSG